MTPLYQRLLGNDWHKLPPLVRALHAVTAPITLHGACDVRRGAHGLARLGAALLALPPDGANCSLSVTFTPLPDGGERWVRHFGRHRFASMLHEQDGWLDERIRFIRLRYRLAVRGDRLVMLLQKMWVCGMPLHRLLPPQITAEEWQEDGRFQMLVSAALPWVGLLVSYRGSLAVPAAHNPDATAPDRNS